MDELIGGARIDRLLRQLRLGDLDPILELAKTEVEGQSGAGLVKITITCKYNVKKISIDQATPLERGAFWR